MGSNVPSRGLAELLLRMFTVDELRRLIRWGPLNDAVGRELPEGPVAPAEFAFRLVSILESHGLVPDFVEQVKAERPRRVAEIVELLGSHPAPAAGRGSTSAPAAPAAATPTPAAEQERALSTAPQIDYLIATALPVEARAVRQLFPGQDGEELLHANGTLVERYTLKAADREVSVGLVSTGHGNESAAVVLQGVLLWLKPKAVVYLGVAGGLRDEVRLGDVVVATKVYAFEYVKDHDEKVLPRPEVRNSAFRFQQRAGVDSTRERWLARLPARPEPPPQVFVKPIAAGSTVVAGPNSRTAALLRSAFSDAYAVEMEGYGALSSADVNKIDAVVVRGISDRLVKDDTSDASWQPRAAMHAAAFTLEMLANLRT